MTADATHERPRDPDRCLRRVVPMRDRTHALGTRPSERLVLFFPCISTVPARGEPLSAGACAAVGAARAAGDGRSWVDRPSPAFPRARRYAWRHRSPHSAAHPAPHRPQWVPPPAGNHFMNSTGTLLLGEHFGRDRAHHEIRECRVPVRPHHHEIVSRRPCAARRSRRRRRRRAFRPCTRRRRSSSSLRAPPPARHRFPRRSSRESPPSRPTRLPACTAAADEHRRASSSAAVAEPIAGDSSSAFERGERARRTVDQR